MSPQFVIQLLSILTLATNALSILFLVFFLFSKIIKKADPFLNQTKKYFVDRAEVFAFIVALTATLGSLFFSEIAGFTPCKLCWFQRIFMYPLPVILGVSLIKKTRDVEKYVLPLSLIGGAIGLYHYIEQISPNPLTPCSSLGFSVSCSERFFTYFGYITIPWMSFSAFFLISALLILYSKSVIRKG